MYHGFRTLAPRLLSLHSLIGMLFLVNMATTPVSAGRWNYDKNYYLNEWEVWATKAGTTKSPDQMRIKKDKITIRYSRAHKTGLGMLNHTLCKVNGGIRKNEWFTIKRAIHHDTRNKTIEFEIRGMNNRYIYYNESKQSMEFIKHLLLDPVTKVTGLQSMIKESSDVFKDLCKDLKDVENFSGIENGPKDPYRALVANKSGDNNCGTYRPMNGTNALAKRRLIEASYYSLIGFNMLLMCAVLVGISFAYRIGNHEANPQPIRW